MILIYFHQYSVLAYGKGGAVKGGMRLLVVGKLVGWRRKIVNCKGRERSWFFVCFVGYSIC